MRTISRARAATRAVAVALTGATLTASGSWAYAAETGVERTGTWVALAAALVVALAAGAAAVADPRGQAAAEGVGQRGGVREGTPARAATGARAVTGPASPAAQGARYAARPAAAKPAAPAPLVPPAVPPVAPTAWSRPPAAAEPVQVSAEEETPTVSRHYFTDDDTMIQRALADEVKARRARTEHRTPGTEQDRPEQG